MWNITATRERPFLAEHCALPCFAQRRQFTHYLGIVAMVHVWRLNKSGWTTSVTWSDFY